MALSLTGVFLAPSAMVGMGLAALSVEKSEGRQGRGAFGLAIVCLVLSVVLYSATWAAIA
ncbi:MAG: hypothetical protein H7Y88_07150 [Phycisphaerales bacterium]|nr:hypothetical protein [Phycisphaerales bacterium]